MFSTAEDTDYLQGSINLDDPYHLDTGYAKMFSTIPYLLKAQSTALVLGLGAGVLPRILRAKYEIATTVVEYDPTVINAFQHFFNPTNLDIDVREGDAIKFPIACNQYEIIFIDLFGNKGVISEIADKPFLKRLISSNSSLAFNFIYHRKLLDESVVDCIMHLASKLPYYIFHNRSGNLVILFTKKELHFDYKHSSNLDSLNLATVIRRFYKGSKFPDIVNLKKRDTNRIINYK